MSESARSASASGSESEAEFDVEDKPVFAYEKLYHNAADKQRIEAMPEIEREALLADRSEQVEKHEQNAQLRRMLHARAKDELKQSEKRKRKASAADLDDNQRKSSRQRTKVGGGRAGEPNSAIAAYKKQREEKSLRDEQRKNRVAERRPDTLLDEYSDADAEGESDVDYDYDHRKNKKKARSPSPVVQKDDPTVELADLQRVRIGRENFAQVCWTPGFEETLTNCFARVCLGPGRNPGQNEYRLCSIKGFQEGRPYAIEGPNHKTFVVNKYIIAAHGKATKPWSFLECSNSRFTDDEWRRYRLTMANEDCRMPTRGQVNAKLDQINALINHRFTDAEISQKVKQQNAMFDMVNRTTERKELKEQIRDAEDRGDDAAIAELEERLMNLVPMKLALGTSIQAPQTTKSKTEVDRIAELNRHNMKQTTENIQKAALMKKKTLKKKALEEAGKLSASAAVPRNLDDDLFGSASDISRTGTPLNGVSRGGTPSIGTPKPNGSEIPRSGTPLAMRTGQEKKGGLPMIKKGKRDDEVLQSMDLGIDIDI